jgi:hypothetical protein
MTAKIKTKAKCSQLQRRLEIFYTRGYRHVSEGLKYVTAKADFFIIKLTRCTNFTNLFWHETVHVSDSSSVHHQEFIHSTLSNGICHTGL